MSIKGKHEDRKLLRWNETSWENVEKESSNLKPLETEIAVMNRKLSVEGVKGVRDGNWPMGGEAVRKDLGTIWDRKRERQWLVIINNPNF